MDSVEISEDGKALQKEAAADAEAQSKEPAAKEPITYVKVDVNTVETAPMKEIKGASVDCSV